MPTVIDIDAVDAGRRRARGVTDCHVTPDAAAMPLASRMNAASAGESGIASWSDSSSRLERRRVRGVALRLARAAPAAAASFARSVAVSALTFDVCARIGFRSERVPQRGDEHRGEDADRKVLGLHGVAFSSWFSRLLCAAGVGTAVAVKVMPPRTAGRLRRPSARS